MNIARNSPTRLATRKIEPFAVHLSQQIWPKFAAKMHSEEMLSSLTEANKVTAVESENLMASKFEK